MTRVLVAYSSKHGATAEIAETIAEELRRKGLEATVSDVDARPPVAPYDAVVLGSALYIFRWRRNARRFARRNARLLASRPLWMFSSGPFDRSAEARVIPPVKGAQRIYDRLHARGHQTFGGRASTAPIVAAMEKEGKPLDYRNFDQVRLWARAVAAELKTGPRAAAGAAGA